MLFCSLKKVLLFFFFIHSCLSDEIPSTVVTNSGKVIGRYLNSFKGNKYEAYQGIPFALPPIGGRRFKSYTNSVNDEMVATNTFKHYKCSSFSSKRVGTSFLVGVKNFTILYQSDMKSPEPVQQWSDVLLANHMRDICLQISRSGVEGSEDCLYLNVFVPRTENRSTTLPTIVWIHGGGFGVGGNFYGEEEYLMDHNIIFVTIQYRLGILGFLSTGDDIVSGNMGLKDQSLAIKWIHQNIEFFKGDPNRIMLLGHSAGAASVHYHYLSQRSAGLFQSGISFSGTALDVWAQLGNSRENAFKLGRIMNCSTVNTEVMIGCLRNRSATDITRALTQFSSWRSIPDVHFGPVVEKSTSDWFINEPPISIINSGKAYDVPWITGVVSEEGLLVVAKYTDDKFLQEINDNWNDIAPSLLKYNNVPEDKRSRLSEIIREHYFAEKFISKETLKTLIHMVGDRWFVVDAEKAARAQAKANKSPVWFYKYSYRAVDSFSVSIANKTDDFGVCHGDDVYLVIKNDDIVPTKSSNDMRMQATLIQLMISFAINGMPNLNVEWPSVNSNKSVLQYLHIDGRGKVSTEINDNLGDKQFWNSMNFNENKI